MRFVIPIEAKNKEEALIKGTDGSYAVDNIMEEKEFLEVSKSV